VSLDVRTVQSADVYKAGHLAASLQRVNGGTEFSYLAEYDGPAVATTLPRDAAGNIVNRQKQLAA